MKITGFSGLDEAGRSEYWACLALRHCRGLGARSCARLLEYFGSAYAAFENRDSWPEAGLSKNVAAELATGSWRVTAQEEWDAVRKSDHGILFMSQQGYPERLRQITDPPILLYCYGQTSLLQAPCVAMVGSRKATAHGIEVSAHFARRLSACGITVVSGMAQGIDSACHDAALSRPGQSIGVLGTGLDLIYPKASLSLFERMRENGLLLSEFAPGTLPLPQNFPIRNRIISGLALAVLVVEATTRSGSLITARLALEQDREVFAVPGAALESHSIGCQTLVREGAKPVFCAEDILRELAPQLAEWDISEQSLPPEERILEIAVNSGQQDKPGLAGSKACKNRAGACGRHGQKKERGKKQGNGSRQGHLLGEKGPKKTADDDAALASGQKVPSQPLAGQAIPDDPDLASILICLLESGKLHVDSLANRLGLQSQTLAVRLLALEMNGLVQRLPGAFYEASLG